VAYIIILSHQFNASFKYDKFHCFLNMQAWPSSYVQGVIMMKHKFDILLGIAFF